jgi:hypothetical protein
MAKIEAINATNASASAAVRAATIIYIEQRQNRPTLAP